jgi:Glycosyltransferase family 87
VFTYRAHQVSNRRWWWIGGWTLAAAWAACFPLVSTLETQRFWGISAGAGYLGAAVAAVWLPRPRVQAVSVSLAITGALLLPFCYLILTGHQQSEVGVIERSGTLLIRHATPYLAHPRTVVEYTPYLPGMAVFGLPRALFGGDGPLPRLLGDARVWCAAALLGCLWAGRRFLRTPESRTAQGRSRGAEPSYGLMASALIASPVVALPLCVSGVELPLTGLLCLALALAGRRRPVAAGLALAAACSLTWMAWPALPVVLALLGHSMGRRAALRCASVSVTGTLALVLPSTLRSPGAMLQQVFAFPTGKGKLPTPARSPLPGQLLAGLGTGGWDAAVALLLVGGLAVAVSLVRRPPYDAVSAADRLALGLCLAFLLAPSERVGYLALPLLLVVWPRLATGPRPARGRTVNDLARGSLPAAQASITVGDTR